MNCKDLEESLLLYLYDELPAEPRAACETHLAACEGCRARLEEARRLHRVLGERAAHELTPDLLVRCRQALDEALDREQVGWRKLLGEWLWPLAARPAPGAVAALTLVVLGFGLGWTLRPRATQVLPGGQSVIPASFVPADIGNLRINSISQVAPDPQTGEVRIRLDAERRVTLEGSLDDPRIRQVLVYAVKGYDNPGIRRDTLDALRTRRDNPSVREAVLYALGRDPNAGVRMEALRTVRGMEWGEDVHQALVESLQRDTNPGVRVSAIDMLVERAVEENDFSLLPVLEKLAAQDSNPYVRMKAVSAVQRLVRDEP